MSTSLQKVARPAVRRKVQDIYQPTSPAALEREGIDVALGPARFESPATLRVGDRVVVARRSLVCTGATPTAPDVTGLAETPHRT